MLSVALLGLLSFDPPKLVRTKPAERISILIPKGWREMDALDFTERYPSVRAPLAGYSDYDRLMDFSVNISATQWPDANVALAQRFFKAALYNSFDRVDMIKEGVREIKGQDYIYFEFESTIKGDRKELGQQESIMKYSYIQYLVTPGRTLVFSFHCPRRYRMEWQETALEMMEGVRVKKYKQ